MKLFVVLALITLAANPLEANIRHLEKGYLYEYKYYTHHLSTIENDCNRQTGMAFTCNVAIQVLTDSHGIFQLENVATASLNEDIYQVDEEELPWKFEPVKGPLKDHLQKSFTVEFMNGKVKSFYGDVNEPHESKNIKKAVVQLFQLSDECLGLPVPLSSNSRSYSSYSSNQLGGGSSASDNRAIRCMEDCIYGDCEFLYVLESNPSPENPYSDCLNITKYVDYSECVDPPLWIRTTQVPNNCTDCQADDEEPFTTIAKMNYDIKKRGSKLTVERIEAEARTLFKPFSTNSDHFSLNHSQIMTFIDKRGLSATALQQAPRPKSYSPQPTTLKYVFPTAQRALKGGNVESLKKAQTPFFYEGKQDVVPKSSKLLREIVREIFDESTASSYVKETPLKLYKLVSNIRLMNLDEIKQFYERSCTPKGPVPIAAITGQICIDALVMSGNHPAIVQVKYLIESKQITGEQACQAVQAIPNNLFEPTNVIVEEIWKIAQSPVARDYAQIRITAILAFAIVVGKACDGPEDDNPSLPNPPHYEDFCSNDIERKYIQMLANELKNAQTKKETMLLLRALGLTELPTAINVISPYAKGDAAEDEFVQRCALNALRAIAKFAPDEVMDIAEDEFYDTDNVRGVRIAAFRVMMASKPDFSDLQRVAAWYQKEPSDDVQGYMLSFFDSISNATHFCLKDMANNAEQMMPFFDEDDYNGIQSSRVWEISQTFGEIGISSQIYCSVTSSNSSSIPETIQCQVNITTAGYSYKPLMFAVNLNGLNPVINRLMGPVGSFSNINSFEDLFKPEEEREDQHYTDINKKLDLRTRRQEPFELSAFLKIADNQARFMYLDHKSIIEKLKPERQGGFTINDLEKGIDVEYYKTSLLYEVQMQTPAIGGVPISVAIRTPSIFTIRGQIKAILHPSSSTKDTGLPGAILFEANLRPSISYAMRASVGVYNPFQTGVQKVSVLRSTYVAVPLTTSVEVNLHQGKTKIAIKPSTTYYQGSSVPQKVFHMSVNPSSTHCSFESLDELCSWRSKPIHIREPEEKEIDLSRKILGFPLVLKSKSEHDWNDAGSFKDWYDDYDSLFTFLSVYWATPEFAARSYDVYLTGRSAEDKEIELSLEWNYLPPPVKELVFKSARNGKGIWPLISGFADLPLKCTPADKYSRPKSKPWYLNLWDKAKEKASQYMDAFNHTSEEHNNYGETLYYFHKQRSSGYEGTGHASPWIYDATSDTDGSGYSPKSSYSSTSRKEGGVTVQKVSRDNEVCVLNVKISAVAKGLSSKIIAKLKLKRNYSPLTDSVSVEIDATNVPIFSESHMQICSTCEIKYPEVPCDYDHLMTPNPDLQIQASAKVNWGSQKCNPSNEISAKVVFKKSKEQLRKEVSKTQWYFAQCQQDILEGKKYTDTCEMAQLEFSSLNKMEADVKYTKLPDCVKNFTSYVDNYLKGNYYKQMSNNPVDVHNGEGHLKVVATLRNVVRSVDLEFHKPTEKTFFQKIFLRAMYPISTQTSILNQFYDDVTNGMATPTCKVMGNYVNTFDNTTYRYKMPKNCKHVIAKDCSPEDLFAVKKADIGNGLKSLEVVLLSHRFVIIPEQRYSGKFKVTVNGQPLQPRDEEVLIISSDNPSTHKKVVAMVTTTGPRLWLIAPMHGIAIETDCEDSLITLSGIWGNRVCGLCGQYDGESGYADFIDPQQCMRPDPVSFGLSYALSGPECTLPNPPNPNRQCDDDYPAVTPYSRTVHAG